MSAPTVKCGNCNKICKKSFAWCTECGKGWNEVSWEEVETDDLVSMAAPTEPQIACNICGAVGTTGPKGNWKCTACAKKKNKTWEKFKDTMSCLGAIGYMGLFLLCCYIIITGLIPACNDVIPRNPVEDWMQNQKYEREEHERRREEQ